MSDKKAEIVESKNAINEKKALPKFVIPTIVIAACVIIIAIIVVMVTGKTKDNASNTATGSNTASYSNDEAKNNTSNEYSPSELEKNVITSGAITKNNKLIAFVTNNNKVNVDMEIEAEFYDNNGVIVGSDKESLQCVGAGAEVAVEMWDTPENWDNYKIYVDLEKSDGISYFDKIKLTHSNTGENIAVQVTNNSEDTIENIEVSVVYYQAETVVGFDDGYNSDTKSNRSANFNLYYPSDKDYDNVEFDNYKIFINQAYSYKW